MNPNRTTFPMPVRGARRAFTLVEMAVSSVIVSLIALAVGSSVTVALRSAQSTRDTGSTYNQTVTARSALDRVTDDMKAATRIEPLYVPTWTSGTVGATLTVPARGSDTSSETIVYFWAGAGQPLMRQYNGQTAVSIADNVQSFNITFSPEQLLIMHDGGTAATVKSNAITTTAWAGEYFKPTLPATATAWKITHVKVQLQRSGASTGNVAVGIWSADGTQKPTGGAALASSNVDITTVAATAGGAWVDVPVSISGLSLTSGYCLVIGTTAGAIGYNYYDSPAISGTVYSTSASGASSWSANSGQTLQFVVYATVTTP
jgi:prepilin-type N-terminal cleavage/methylation domain-containing protein